MTNVNALKACIAALGGTPSGNTCAELIGEIAVLVQTGGGAGTYVLPTADADTLGGVKVGLSLAIDDGVLDYDLPVATSDALGGIKVGTNLSIEDGVLSATDTTYGAASTTDLGLVKVDGTTIVINDGVISVAPASD